MTIMDEFLILVKAGRDAEFQRAESQFWNCQWKQWYRMLTDIGGEG